MLLTIKNRKMKGRKIIIPVMVILVITGIWGFVLDDWNKKVTYTINIVPVNGTESEFDTSLKLSGETIRLKDQKAPYKTEIIARELECIIDSDEKVSIIISSEHGRIEGEFRSAFISAGVGKNRIFGI